jgi:hypothetical protein
MKEAPTMKFKLAPKFPDFPGSKKTYPKFIQIDGKPPTEHQKVKALLKLTGDELGFISKLSKTYGNLAVFRRLQVRQLSSVLDSFFGTLNYSSLEKQRQGELDISVKDQKRLKGYEGIMISYKTSIKIYARAMDVPNPNGGEIQVRGAVKLWPALRARITHPRTLEQYQFTACDTGIIQATGNWFKEVQDWALQLELQKIAEAKKTINKSLNGLKREILSNTKKAG